MLKATILGILAGLLYSTVSFCLITPYLRQDFSSILFFGLQGAIFGFCYSILTRFLGKWDLDIRKRSLWVAYVIIGGICGIASATLYVAVAYYGAILSFSGVVDPNLKKELLSNLGYYLIGCIVIGVTAGIVIAKPSPIDRS